MQVNLQETPANILLKMSTRSGKRIHSSFHESTMKVEEDLVPINDRKTRSKRPKENNTQLDLTLPKARKRNNYVRYPTDDESNTQTMVTDIGKVKNPRKLLKNTLKDHNISSPVTESGVDCLDPANELKQGGRQTRRTKKFAENAEDILENIQKVETKEFDIVQNKKIKKSKKNKKKDVTEPDNEMGNGDIAIVPVKKSKRKKRGKGSNSEESHRRTDKTKSLNKSSTSVDSFHSAAGSPMKESSVSSSLTNEPDAENPPVICENLNTTYEANKPVVDMVDSNKKQKNKSSIKNSTFNNSECHTPNLTLGLNSTFDKNEKPTDILNTTYEKEPTVGGSESALNSTLVKSSKGKTVSLNSTYDRNDVEVTKNINNTFEKEPTVRKSTGYKEILNNTFEKTAERQSKTISLNSTYDKVPETKLDTTFEQSNSRPNSGKSSLISSDATINITFDKSNENSRISITSDDSKTENIINTTPVLIESSMDESHASINMNHIPVTSKESVDDSKAEIKPPPTIIREGTFTKDSPDVLVSSPKSKTSVKTPTRRMTLPSPGCTPFHTSRSSQVEKSVVTVTRSIDKSLRRSSLADLEPRQTRVMFCSPVNSPAVAVQQKRKVIKSSMKGSNKSFVIDERVASRAGGRAGGAAGRKRSLTQNDAEDVRARAKRSRLASAEQQHSATRLSRPRTFSAAAKLSGAPPAGAPSASKASRAPAPGRGKLPDFAALHQRRFDKMESLTECQERKRQRARHLLTPTARLAVLERSSPTGINLEPMKEPTRTPKKEIATPKETTTKKPMTASKTLPTLESLRPGYTRFGFKLNIGVNPFDVPGKNGLKVKENKSNGVAKVPIKPSLAGATSSRKEVAKQNVMREKSFTSLAGKRDLKRIENRTIIKGVRTNRRFDLQMKMRDIN